MISSRSIVLATVLYLFCMPLSLAAEQTPRAIDRLAPLRDIPLPGETAIEDERPIREKVESLIGKTIVKVTAPGAPAGFDPLTDADIPLGIEFSRAQIRAAVRRLWDTGRYRDVKVSGRLVNDGAVALEILVKPMLRIGRLSIQGNSALDREKIGKAIEYTPGRTIMPDPEVLRAFRQNLLTLYQNSGYREARAALSILTTEEAGVVELLVDIKEGAPDRYTSIVVEGLPDDVPIDVVGIKKGTIRNREQVEQKIQQFIEKLAEHGYVDAVAAPFQEKRISRYKMALTIPVDSGIPTRMAFHGNEHFLSRDLQDFIEKDGPVKSDPETLSKKREKLVEYLKTYGYLFAEVTPMRRCFYVDEAVLQSIYRRCGESALRQIVEFRIDEGPNVEVLNVLFEGNRWFSDKDLEEELFAFVSEKNSSDEMFQPIDTVTVDDLGISDKPSEHAPPRTGLSAPLYKRSRVYVPNQYKEATEHLTGVYQEQGFLSVSVKDTCDETARRSMIYRGTEFSPLRIDRKSDTEESAEEEQGQRVPCVFYNREEKQLLVTVQIEEEAQTTISELRFEGNRSFSSKALQDASDLSVSSPYNEYQIKQGARKIEALYRSIGHMFSEVTFEKYFSEDMRRARIVYTVNEGPLTRVGLVRIEGAETTAYRLIREVITLEPGDLITPEKIEKSQLKLMDLGIFSGATVQLVSPEIPAEKKNIKVQVTEAKPQYLELRWGVATVEGLRSSFEYGYNNIAGWALGATLRARANYRLFFVGNEDFEERYKSMTLTKQLEHHVLVGIGSPHLIGTKGLLGWGIDFIKERLNKPGFSASRLTTFLRLNSKLPVGKDYPHGLVLFGRTGIEYNLDISSGQQLDNPFLQQYLRLPQGRSAFYVIGLNVAVDLRDSPFNPTKGFYFSIGGDWVYSLPFAQDNKEERFVEESAPIKESSNLIRAEVTTSGYVPILDTDIVFAVSFTAGYIFHLTGDSITWPDRYFYVGGIDTLRGFPEDSLIPQDAYEYWKDHLDEYGEDVEARLKYRGGESMFVARAELRYPLARGFLGAVFAEAGNVWRERDKTVPIRFKPNFELNLRPVAGVGIRYQTPLGPISFDLGVNIKRRHTEAPFSWYISIGTAF